MRLALALVFASGPAFAEVTVANCRPDTSLGDRLLFTRFECDLTNLGSVAVAQVTYSATFTGEGRTVPWGEVRRSFLRGTPRVPIAGGVEPGETVTVSFAGIYLPERANPEQVRINLSILRVYDVDGDLIE